MQTLERFAEVSVARGCGFAGIAIGTIMIGFAEHIPTALEIGGILALITCFVLFVKGHLALYRPYKRTELWMMLGRLERPDPAIAQQVIGRVLRQTYLRYALYTAGLAALMLAMSLLLQLNL